MSHIRFSLFIAFAIIGMVYGLFTKQRLYVKLFFVVAVVWLLFFMNKLEMATGFFCLMVVGPILLIFYSLKKLSKKVALSIFVLIVISGLFLFTKAVSSLRMFDMTPNNPANIFLEKNPNGTAYRHDTSMGSSLAENGTLTNINFIESEVEKEWNKKQSDIFYTGKDKKGNQIRHTIFRYLASKGLPKDSASVASLTSEDVKNIEKGITNYKYSSNSGLIAKWRELVWEYTNYKHGQNPSGHSLSMRLEFWKTACYIINKHRLIGVGTGDVQIAFNVAYEETKSKLDIVWRLRCHNQYLAITVAFGFIGLLVFIFYLFYPTISLRKKLHYLYWPFFLVSLLSFVTEDTLETQSGVTFFIFFHALFLWLASTKTENEHNV